MRNVAPHFKWTDSLRPRQREHLATIIQLPIQRVGIPSSYLQHRACNEVRCTARGHHYKHMVSGHARQTVVSTYERQTMHSSGKEPLLTGPGRSNKGTVMVSHAGVMEQRFQGRGLVLQPIMAQ